MLKILFYTRNNAEKHVIVKNILSYLKTFTNVKVIPFKSVFRIKKEIDYKKVDWVYHDDPIAFVIFSLFGVKANKIFHSLEMFEYQVDLNSIKRVLRYFVFLTCHWLALRNSNLIIFPNELRRDFYLEKYKWLKTKNVVILENIPRNLEGALLENIPENDLVKTFVSKFKKTLVITGAIGEGRDIDKIINKFSRQNEYGLCVITQSEAHIPKSNSILVLRNLPHSSVLGLYGYFDAGLLSYDNHPLNVKFCAPTKMYEYLASGLYVIGNDNYSLRHNDYCDCVFYEPSEILEFLSNLETMKRKETVVFDLDKKLQAILNKIEIKQAS